MDTTNLQEEVLSRLDALAEKLGVATEHLWAIFTQQSLYEGWYGLCAIILAIIVAVSAFAYGFKNRIKNKDLAVGFMIGGGLILVICIIVGIIPEGGQECFTKVVNPEYHAWLEIKEIMK